ncbi:protein jagged-1b isoform X1 [Pangasianodon hypophthalmus]|uniref:protein jagged-1b isoform X1 n=1 Tax=Pangasianodon hypophthalmus TaxID=310915 RepID=UPI000EFDC23C|nr:protein jagged-1b isoform X1 [Pangasianodon hypophthalmus]
MSRDRAGLMDRGHRRTAFFLLALAFQALAVDAVGMFELQIRQWQNSLGVLQSSQCCDLQPSGAQRCSQNDQCDTFFRVCLKEYQARVAPTGTCTFGTGSTPVLGGNSHGMRHQGSEAGRVVIPFKYAWPKSFSLVIEALDHDNATSEPVGQEELIDRVLLSSMLNPGEQWQSHKHHGRHFTLEYRLRFRCDTNYYGPLCNKFCRARDDFFGHFDCDTAGSKVCKDGWTGPECRQAVCKQGCNMARASCTLPGECECHYGWKGDLCDECETFPGCDHGSCMEPWQCVCDTNWGGLLCDKDLNYCGTHQPCKNGGTCINTEPNEYQCVCQDGFRGRDCSIVEHACLTSPCVNGATCKEDQTGFSCVCADGWTGPTCALAVLHCDSHPCGRGATCLETAKGFQCLCPPGWTGKTCQIDMNECETGICVNARSCRNLIGGYLCDCLPGWVGLNCDTKNSSCQGLCLNGGRCEDSHCVCLPGFTGKLCQTVVGMCDSTPCLHGGQCEEQKDEGSIVCNCPPGYTGTYCETMLDPCNPNPCQKGVPCHSTESGYMCACPEGYFGNECMSLKELCHGPHCQDTVSGMFSVYMVLLGALAVLVAIGCSACALLLSRLHRRQRPKQQPNTTPPDAAINNQRQFCTLIRNVEHTTALLGPGQTQTQTILCGSARPMLPLEEIELTLPTSQVPPHNQKPDPPLVLKPNLAPKLDICNREREKLNRFHHSDNQEVEA